MDMSRKGLLKLTGYRLPVWTFAFILSLAQVYPAFGACLCVHVTPESAELSATAEEGALTCHTAPDQADARVEVATDTATCSSDADPAGTGPRISRDECCVALISWTPPAFASVSRAVEIRTGFDANSWGHAEDPGVLFLRFESLSPPLELDTLTRIHPPLYLINASLLI